MHAQPSELACDRRDAAAQAAIAAEHRFEAARRTLVHDVTAAFAELYYVDRAIVLTREMLEPCFGQPFRQAAVQMGLFPSELAPELKTVCR